MKKLLLLALLSAVLCTGLLFASGSEETTAPKEATTLKLGGEPETGPFSYPWWSAGYTNRFLYKRLLNSNENLEPVYPSMAKDWSISDDGLEISITLRDDMKWHDGEPITMEDVVWSIETSLLGSRIHSTFKNAFGSIEGAAAYREGTADSVSGLKVSGNTLAITMANPSAFIDMALGQFAPLPKHLLENEDPATLQLSTHWEWPIGSGPFKISEREPGDYTILEPFDDYFLGKPKIDKVVLRYWSDIVAAAESGELDFGHTTDITAALQIMEMPNMKVTPVDIGYMRFMWVNMARKPFDDVRVRQALLYALDRESIVEDLFEGQGFVLPTTIQPSWTKDGLEPYPYDPEKARQLLADANWPSDHVVVLGHYYKDQTTKDLLATVQYYWGQVGIKSEPYLLEGNLVELLYEKKEFDVCYVGLSSPEPQDATERYTTGHTLNAISYNNPEFDALVKKGGQTVGYNNRKPIYDRVQEIMYEEVPMLPLYSLYNFALESTRLKRPTDIRPNDWFEGKLDWQLWEIEE